MSEFMTPVAGSGSGVPTTRKLFGTSPILIDGGANADLSIDRTISIPRGTASVPGYIHQIDFTNFSNKANTANPTFGRATINGLTVNVTSYTNTYIVLNGDDILLYTNIGSPINLTLPDPSGNRGKIYILIKMSVGGGGGVVNIVVGGTGAIVGTGAVTSLTTQFQVLRLFSDGTNYVTW